MRFSTIALVIVVLALAGCMTDQNRQDVHDNAQASYNAAASLPDSPQTQAIKACQVAVGAAVGLPITVPVPTVSTPAAAVPAVAPAH